MRVLLTGDAGLVGRSAAAALGEHGIEVVGFDIARGEDLRDAGALERATLGCDAVVHAAAITNDSRGTPAEIFAANVTGTWNALRAAEAAGVQTFVYFSSAQAFGIAEGEQPPVYLPIDDAHPRNATRAYGLSKCFAEDLCAASTRRTGMTTIALRPVAVWDEGTFDWIWGARQRDPSFEWSPFWEFGAFVDVSDVAAAVMAAVHVHGSPGVHERVTLCASDISASEPSLALADRLLPTVPWLDGAREQYEGDPWRAIFDTSAARRVLGWSPEHTWQAWLEAKTE